MPKTGIINQIQTILLISDTINNMKSNYRPSLEEFNYRESSEEEFSCINCNRADDNLKISDNGVKISKCYFFNMEVDEFHICDLINYL
jgi:hypothetical protein